MIRVNLMPESVIAARQQKRRVGMWLRVGAAYAGIWVVAAAFSNEVVQDPAAPLETKLASLVASRTGVEASVALLQSRHDQLAGRARVVRDITGQPDWSIMLRHLASYLGDAVGLRSVSVHLSSGTGESVTPSNIANGPYEVTVLGIAAGQAEATRYALELESAGLFSSLTLTQTSPTRIAQRSAVLFELRGTISIGGKP